MIKEAWRPSWEEAGEERARTPRRGDRIELKLPRLGIRQRGRVQYVDHLQILVKWDDGRSEGLRGAAASRFRIVESPNVEAETSKGHERRAG